MEEENPQTETGGLKLMTVFIVVLTLHVLVIGGISAYHYFWHQNTVTIAETENEFNELPETFGSDLAPTSPLAHSQSVKKEAELPAPPSPRDLYTAQLRATDITIPTGGTSLSPAKEESKSSEPLAPVVEKKNVEQPLVAASKEYVVKKGDTLYGIAQKFKWKVARLKEKNKLSSNVIRVGQKLVISSPSEEVLESKKTIEPEAKPEQPAVSLAVSIPPQPLSLAKEVPQSKPKAKEKEATYIYGEDSLSTPSKYTGLTYTIVKGDTLYKIARKFNTTTKAIIAANELKNPNRLTVGDKLKIPGEVLQQSVKEPKARPHSPYTRRPLPEADLVMNR